ncbi:MAG: hypothetical protein HUK20_07115 [Fibrobacter sp.]|nr:hypothetical protein [Fibrobacter sp.]
MIRFSLLILLTAVLFSGCSVNLAQANLEGIPLTTEKYSFFGSIPLLFNQDSIELSQNLLKAYTAAVDAQDYPRDKCRGSAKIRVEVNSLDSANAMSLGLAFIPLWPYMPIDERWTYKLDARIFCEGTLVRHILFDEEARLKATFYGRLRSDLLNKTSAEMHRKLVERLTYELTTSRPADLNIVSDF